MFLTLGRTEGPAEVSAGRVGLPGAESPPPSRRASCSLSIQHYLLQLVILFTLSIPHFVLQLVILFTLHSSLCSSTSLFTLHYSLSSSTSHSVHSPFPNLFFNWSFCSLSLHPSLRSSTSHSVHSPFLTPFFNKSFCSLSIPPFVLQLVCSLSILHFLLQLVILFTLHSPICSSTSHSAALFYYKRHNWRPWTFSYSRYMRICKITKVLHTGTSGTVPTNPTL
jgi:hypothetical protein